VNSSAGEQIEFSEVGSHEGPLELPEAPAQPSTPPGQPARRVPRVPGAGAIPIGAAPITGAPVATGGPPIVRDAGPPAPPPPNTSPFTFPQPTAPLGPGVSGAASVTAEGATAALAPEAEKRIRGVVDQMITQAEERLKKSGEATAKGILDQFASQGGKRFVERISTDVATLALAALKPIETRRLVGTAVACVLIIGVAIGSLATTFALRPRSAQTAAAALLADPHMAQSLGSLARTNDAATIMRIAICDPALGLVRRRAQDGRMLCAGAGGARFGWATGR
jgi:hypothetical protein